MKLTNEQKFVVFTIIIALLVGSGARVDGLTGNFEVKESKKPFEVIVNDFQVHPLAQEVEDEYDVWTFRISYNVTNIGDYYGNYRVRAFINKQLVDSEVFFLEAGETQSYLFEVERGVGKYEIEVEDFTENIEVLYEPKVTDYVPYVAVGVIVALGLIGIWWKRR